MSEETFSDRTGDDAPGRFYVCRTCLDCDLCRETAPTIFRRNGEEGTTYVYKQPEREEEVLAVIESMEGCCTESIYDDGDEHDWNASLRKSKNAPWWKFW